MPAIATLIYRTRVGILLLSCPLAIGLLGLTGAASGARTTAEPTRLSHEKMGYARNHLLEMKQLIDNVPYKERVVRKRSPDVTNTQADTALLEQALSDLKAEIQTVTDNLHAIKKSIADRGYRLKSNSEAWDRVIRGLRETTLLQEHIDANPGTDLASKKNEINDKLSDLESKRARLKGDIDTGVTDLLDELKKFEDLRKNTLNDLENKYNSLLVIQTIMKCAINEHPPIGPSED